jgi:hypothetical protein
MLAVASPASADPAAQNAFVKTIIPFLRGAR